MMEKPLVSVCCITYNHAPFIRQSLDGMLMQEGVDYEILIHDDCSTDGTTEIVKEYAAMYPDKIFPLYEEVNQYQNGKAGEIDFYNYRRARGKYIAYCEGDDYWTDSLKLQKQVEFMESHPDYSVCFHECVAYNTLTGETYTRKQKGTSDVDLTPEMFINGYGYMGQPLTMLFRKSCFSFDWRKHYTYYRDTMETYHILRAGKGRYLRFQGGVCNMHTGGVSAFMPNNERASITVPSYIEMYVYTKDAFLRKMIVNSVFWALDIFRKSGEKKEIKQLYILLAQKVPTILFEVVLTSVKRKIKHIIGK